MIRWLLFSHVTGVALWPGNPKPLWISFMERFGGMVALLSVGVISLMLRRAHNKSNGEERVRGFAALSRIMTSVGTLVTMTIFVVMFRLT